MQASAPNLGVCPKQTPRGPVWEWSFPSLVPQCCWELLPPWISPDSVLKDLSWSVPPSQSLEGDPSLALAQTELGRRGWTRFNPSPMVGTWFEGTKWDRDECGPSRSPGSPQSPLQGSCSFTGGFPWPRLGSSWEMRHQNLDEDLWSPHLELLEQVQDPGQREQQSAPKWVK